MAAWLVLFSHQHALIGLPEPGIGLHSLGGLGVIIFFTISGFLVAQSWERDPSLGRFLVKRALRIWPGLIAVTALCAFVLGPALSTLPLRDYFADADTWKFFRTLRMSVRYELPGVFADLPLPNVVNGSLWTLPIEVRWYLVLALAGVLCVLRRAWLLAGSVTAFGLYVFLGHNLQHNPDRDFDLEFGLFFCFGVCLHRFRAHWVSQRLGWVCGALAVAALSVAAGQPYLGLLIAVPILILVVGLAATPGLRAAGQFGDPSYGAYLYAFPVQQSLLALGATDWPLWFATTVGTVVTLALAKASWHLVESPALRLKVRLGAPSGTMRLNDPARI